jgi:hypothetical protein
MFLPLHGGRLIGEDLFRSYCGVDVGGNAQAGFGLRLLFPYLFILKP